MTRTLNERAQDAASLEDLGILLCNATEAGRIDEIDTTSLPTFGGPDVEDTMWVYSWDADNCLVPGSEDHWVIYPRCRECGEVAVLCGH